jgi:hypothetical protein
VTCHLLLTQHFDDPVLPRGAPVPALVPVGVAPQRPLLRHHNVPGLPQLNPDQHIQHSYESHRADEEEESGNLERVLEEIRHHRAPAVLHAPLQFVFHPELDGLRRRQTQSHYPDDDDVADDPGELRHGVRQEGVADGQVALHSEGCQEETKSTGGVLHFGNRRGRVVGPWGTLTCDGQHRRVGRRLGREPLQDAERLPEDVRLGGPQPVHLRGQPRDEQQHIRDGQAEEVVVGGGVHRLVASDHDASAHVPDHPRDEDDRVHHRHGDDQAEGVEDGGVVPEGRVGRVRPGLGAVPLDAHLTFSASLETTQLQPW